MTISQSAKSPDIVALQAAARKGGALAVAVVNVEDSPIGRGADICLPLWAGLEQSVAATKSLIMSLAASASIIAHWSNQADLLRALHDLPKVLERAKRLEWSEAVESVENATSLDVLSRGPALPIAAEAALKLKETCAIHAEVFSIAEIMHGPLELWETVFQFSFTCPETGCLKAPWQPSKGLAKRARAWWRWERAARPLLNRAIQCLTQSV